MEIKIQEFKQVFVAWTNSDCTEGRGYQYPYCVAASRETAIRMGRKRSVQGSDCNVTECTAVRINNQWLVPGRIELETAEDKKAREAREEKEAIMAKAKAAGLTDDEIAIISR